MPDEVRRWVWRRRLRSALLLLGVVGVGVAAFVVGRHLTPEPTTTELWAPGPPEAPRPAPVAREPERAAPAPVAVDPEVLLAELWDELELARAEGAHCGGRWVPPAGELAWSAELEDAAFLHLDYMIEADDWAHETPGDPTGRTPAQRVRATGFAGAFRGEVIAWGPRTPRRAAQWWLDSPAHCPAVLDARATHVGVAILDDPATEGRAWIAVFGALD